MKVSKTGYKKNSKDKKEKSLMIPSNRITMRGVEDPVFGIDNLGNSVLMMPGGEYQFPGNVVTEYPMKRLKKLNKKQEGGISPGYTMVTGAHEPMGKRDLQTFWDAQQKGKSYRIESEITPDAKGKQYYSYYYYPTDQHNRQKPIVRLPAQTTPQRKVQIPDPMKQPGFAGMLEPVVEQYEGGGPLGGLLSNPLVRAAAPIAANLFLPGSGFVVGPALDLLSGANKEEGGTIKKDIKKSPQGKTIDQYLKDRNTEFVDYIAANNRNAMIKEEVSDFMSGGGYHTMPDGSLMRDEDMQSGGSLQIDNNYLQQLTRNVHDVQNSMIMPPPAPPSQEAGEGSSGGNGLEMLMKLAPMMMQMGGNTMDIDPRNIYGLTKEIQSMRVPSDIRLLQGQAAGQGSGGAAFGGDMLGMLSGFMQDGGSMFPTIQQQGVPIQTTGPAEGSNFYGSGPYGPYSNTPLVNEYAPAEGGFKASGTTLAGSGVPDYVASFQQVGGNQGQKKRQTTTPSVFGDGYWGETAGILGTVLDIYNSEYNDREAKRKKEWLLGQMSIDKMIAPNYGNKGDYDVNSGRFRPNVSQTPRFQKGGSPPYGLSLVPLNNRQDSLDFERGYNDQLNIVPYNPYYGSLPSSLVDSPYSAGSQWGSSESEKKYKSKPRLSNEEVRKRAENTSPQMFNNLSPYDQERVNKIRKREGKKSYKKGGTYSVKDSDIADLIAQGYEFEIVD